MWVFPVIQHSAAQGLQPLAILLFSIVKSTESVSDCNPGGPRRVRCKTPREIGSCDYWYILNSYSQRQRQRQLSVCETWQHCLEFWTVRLLFLPLLRYLISWNDNTFTYCNLAQNLLCLASLLGFLYISWLSTVCFLGSFASHWIRFASARRVIPLSTRQFTISSPCIHQGFSLSQERIRR